MVRSEDYFWQQTGYSGADPEELTDTILYLFYGSVVIDRFRDFCINGKRKTG
jgi:hypothetical protein